MSGDSDSSEQNSRRLDTAEVSLVLSRLIELTDVASSPETVRSAALDAGVSDGTEWRALLVTACRSLGLSVASVDATVAVLVPTVGPGQPAIGRGNFEGQERLMILVESRGKQIIVEVAGEPEPRSLSRAELEAATGDPSAAVQWITIEAPFPRADNTTPLENGGRETPEPRARLWAWLRLEKHDVLTVLIYAVFVGIFTLTTPVAVQALVNTVAFGTLLQPLFVLSVMLFAALAFAATLRGLQFWVVEVLQRRIFVRVVADLARRLPRVRRDALDGHDGQELANRFFEVVSLQKSVSSLLLGGLEVALTIVVGMVVLAFYHPFLFAFDLVLLLATGVVMWLGRRGPATAIAESKAKYEIAAWLEALARNEVTFKLGGGLDYAEAHANSLTRGWLTSRSDHFGVVIRQFVLVLTMQAIAGAAVLGIGGWLVIERQLTLGQLVAAELIVTVVVSSITKLGRYLEVYYDLLASLDKLGHLVDLPTERAGGTPCVARVTEDGTAALGLELAADDLVAGYGNGPDILRGASFKLIAGSKNVIIGEDGSGKSLLVELVAALREPRSGRIAIDTWDSRALDIESLRQRIAVVRTATILPGSLLENVRMGRPGISAQEIQEALSMVGLEDAINRLPDGLHTELSSVGEPLSPAERSRVVFARALVAKPALLVVDDALDNLQPSVRQPMLDLLTDRTRPWTLLVVSKDRTASGRYDQRFIIEDGLVQAEGSK